MADTQNRNNQAQLLDDIESFSRQGPLPGRDEAPKRVIARARVTFPELNLPSPAPGASAERSKQTAAPPAMDYPPELSTGGLLDQFRQQAQTLQVDQNLRDAAARRRDNELSSVLGTAFRYLDALLKQVNIVKPAVPREYLLTGNIAFAGLSWVEGMVDYRKLAGSPEENLWDTVSVRYRIAAPRPVSVEREVLAIGPLSKMLQDAGLGFRLEERKNQRQRVESGLFHIPAEIKAGFLFRADYAAGDLFLRTRNVDRFGAMEFRLPAAELTQATLDDLVQLMLGRNSRFLQRFRRKA